MGKKITIKKMDQTEIPVRCEALMHGPIQTKVKGSPKGKRGYDRKDKSWKNC